MTDGLLRTLTRNDVPAGVVRWRLSIPAQAEHATDPDQWSGALVLIERGALDVECMAGGSRRFAAGDMLAFDWLPIRLLRNRGDEECRLLAIRRVNSRPQQATE